MLLLDTCTLLWLAARQDQLSRAAQKAISDNPEQLYVSSISAYEIGLKSARGALQLPIPATSWFPEAIDHHGIIEIPLSSVEALTAAALPRIHNDPFDRIIIATAISYPATIVTPDHLISAYAEVESLW